MAKNHNPFEIFKNNPFLDENFFQEIARVGFSSPADVLNHLGRSKWPPLNLVETPNELLITAEIPGLQNKGDVVVELKGNTLNINGEITSRPHALQEVTVHNEERLKGKFSRSVDLPVAINSKSVRATYQQGVLEIRLTKLTDSQVETLNIDFFK